MTDIEHEFVIENEALRAAPVRVREIAARGLIAATEAQDAAVGYHDAWLDQAMTEIRSDESNRRS